MRRTTWIVLLLLTVASVVAAAMASNTVPVSVMRLGATDCVRKEVGG